MSNHHATCIAFGTQGVLIRGPSGSGKSTLALQLMDQTGFGLGGKALRARLVSDDQTIIDNLNGKLWASPPPALAGLIEIRGLGLIEAPFKKRCRLHVVVDLVPEAQITRLPEPADLQTLIEGVNLPRIALGQGNPAAATILRSALHHLA